MSFFLRLRSCRVKSSRVGCQGVSMPEARAIRIRDRLLTAEFRDRARLVNQDIRTLNEIVAAYNASA